MENKKEEILNRLLVQLFNDILHIEEKAMKNTKFANLSITEIHTIEAVGKEGNRTMGEIAHDLRITVGTLTTAINRLIKKGYVERKRIEEDRRVVLVNLTEIGEEVFNAHSIFHKEMIDAILEAFKGEDLEILTKLLYRTTRFFERKYESFQ